jgi:hypothetical protein
VAPELGACHEAKSNGRTVCALELQVAMAQREKGDQSSGTGDGGRR